MQIHRSFCSLLICLLVASGPLAAQHLRFGVIAGTALTDDYPTTTLPPVIFPISNGPTFVVPGPTFNSGGRSLIGGPTLSWDFEDLLSIETNAIYRRLQLDGIGPTVTWEFPVLGKYRIPIRSRVHPFLEGGPSWRTTGNKNTNPSHVGVTGGVGLDWHWRGFRFAPVLRYTRWAADPSPKRVFSRQDQIELLFEVSHGALGNTQPFGSGFRIGVAGGFTALTPIAASSVTTANPPTNVQTTALTYSHAGIIGARLEVDLPRHLTLLGEANYRKVHGAGVFTSNGGSANFIHDVVFWQLPVLLRYRFDLSAGGRSFQPFLDAGPSFRLPQQVGVKTSHFGLTGAAGVIIPQGRLQFEVGTRYTYWGPSRYESGEVAPNTVGRNQLDEIFAVVF